MVWLPGLVEAAEVLTQSSISTYSLAIAHLYSQLRKRDCIGKPCLIDYLISFWDGYTAAQ